MAFGCVTARQGNQVGFASIIRLAIPVGLGVVVQHAVQSLLPIPAFGAEHRALRRVQGHRHLRSTPSVVSLEQDARPIDDPSRALAAPDQLTKLVPIFQRTDSDSAVMSARTAHTGRPHLERDGSDFLR